MNKKKIEAWVIGLLCAGLVVWQLDRNFMWVESPPIPDTLSIVSISPAPGTAVTRETVVTAELEYSMSSFVPELHYVMAQADMNQPGYSFDGTFPAEAYPIMKERKGRLSFSFPLRHIWDSPDLKHPITMRFALNKRGLSLTQSKSLSVAVTDKIRYEPVADQP
jgi:hypothetical protein